MKTALAIFAKTAELSPVKTRLAADIGAEKARAFYALSVKTIEAVVQAVAARNITLTPYWCIGEEDGINYPQWESFPTIWTGDGSLGTRLASISEKLFESHDAVIFIGTDSPQLPPDTFTTATNMLVKSSATHISGPAQDGGFYLFASSIPVPRTIWEMVEYSQATTLQDLNKYLLETGITTYPLEAEQDVDTIEDLKTLKLVLETKKPELLPAQAQLLQWLDEEGF